MKRKLLKQILGVGLVALALMGSLALVHNAQQLQVAQEANLQQTELPMDKAISVLP
jgi:hypothetical protein